jgi:hypothetical protein
VSGAIKERLGVSGYLLVGVAILACLAGILFVGDQPKNGIRVEQLEADLNQQLPLGSSWEEAEAWFAARGLKASGIYRGAECRRVGLIAAVPNDTFLEKAHIVISLSFCPEGRLEKYEVARIIHPPR